MNAGWPWNSCQLGGQKEFHGSFYKRALHARSSETPRHKSTLEGPAWTQFCATSLGDVLTLQMQIKNDTLCGAHISTREGRVSLPVRGGLLQSRVFELLSLRLGVPVVPCPWV